MGSIGIPTGAWHGWSTYVLARTFMLFMTIT